jgi:hypothetical protein
MRSKLMLCMTLSLAAAAFAKDPKVYQSAKLVQMDSVSCGTDARSEKTQDILCQEYVVQADKVVYRVRPRDQKHPVLLPVSDHAQFRLQKNKMLLRVEDFDSKEREFTVVSMTPRTDADSADATPARLNHLQ